MMAETPDSKSKSGSFKPQDLRDRSKHQQLRIFEEDRSTTGGAVAAHGDAEEGFERGEDMIAHGEATVGGSAGPDTTGAVAPPAERNRPGLATKLGGTPGANATSSGGRDGSY
jgi:hypothetical protein